MNKQTSTEPIIFFLGLLQMTLPSRLHFKLYLASDSDSSTKNRIDFVIPSYTYTHAMPYNFIVWEGE